MIGTIEVWEFAIAFFLGLCGGTLVMGGLLTSSMGEQDALPRWVGYAAALLGGAVLVIALLIAQGALW